MVNALLTNDKAGLSKNDEIRENTKSQRVLRLLITFRFKTLLINIVMQVLKATQQSLRMKSTRKGSNSFPAGVWRVLYKHRSEYHNRA